MEEETQDAMTIIDPCNAAAPLVVNGASYCGCQRNKDHEGPHEIKVSWSR